MCICICAASNKFDWNANSAPYAEVMNAIIVKSNFSVPSHWHEVAKLNNCYSVFPCHYLYCVQICLSNALGKHAHLRQMLAAFGNVNQENWKSNLSVFSCSVFYFNRKEILPPKCLTKQQKGIQCKYSFF